MNRLFIYIPTWRRHALLEEQIERLVVAMKEFRNVHVLVSSNGESIDNFPKLSKLIEEDNRFSFRQNPANIGGDANILTGFVLAQPEDALWILADDNPITVDSISIILGTLESNWDILGMNRYIEFENNFVFDNKNYGLKFLGESTEWGLVSSAVYNVNSIADSIYRGFELFNSAFCHLAILLDAAEGKNGLQILQINANLIHRGNVFETGTDYAQSLTGGPLLFLYETKIRQKSMSRNWLWENGSALFANRKQYPHQYLLTKVLLRKWCGFISFYFLFGVAVCEQYFYESRLGKKIRSRFRNSNLVRKLFLLFRKPIHIQRSGRL